MAIHSRVSCDHARLAHLGADAPGVDGLGLEDVPVGHDHLALGEQWHQVRGDEVAGPVEAGLAPLRIQLAEPVADRHVGADDQDHVGEPGVGAVIDLVQDAPGGQHPHHGRLARARGHLAGVSDEPAVALGLLGVAGLVAGYNNPLSEIGAGLGEEDDRLGRFALGEEQPAVAAVAGPPLEQLQGRPCHPGIAGIPPGVDPLAEQVDQLQFGRDAADLPLRVLGLGIAVEVHRLPPLLATLRRFPLDDVPVSAGHVERRVQDRLGDLVAAHGGVGGEDIEAISTSRTTINGGRC